MALLTAFTGALGMFWLYTAAVLGWQGFGFGPALSGRQHSARLDLSGRLRQAAGGNVSLVGFASATASLFAMGAVVGYAVFGGVVPPLALGAFASTFLFTTSKARQATRRRLAQEAWPRMISEIRLQTASMGRSVPQALFDVGRRAPSEMQPAFEAAHREWRLTTDLARTAKLLKEQLGDPSADMVCEALLIAHELGGHELDERLSTLAEDRFTDLAGRKDARSRQAGARFARVFVLLVPFGMALAGISIGNGRAAYGSGTGQVIVSLALALIIGCWFWAGRIMRLPETERVFCQ